MRIAQIGLVLALVSLLSACSESGGLRSLGTITPKALSNTATEEDRKSTIRDVFNTNVSTTPVKVNRYIWQASLEVLDFMPIESIDPFLWHYRDGVWHPSWGAHRISRNSPCQ
jgi:hypothetical protein